MFSLLFNWWLRVALYISLENPILYNSLRKCKDLYRWVYMIYIVWLSWNLAIFYKISYMGDNSLLSMFNADSKLPIFVSQFAPSIDFTARTFLISAVRIEQWFLLLLVFNIMGVVAMKLINKIFVIMNSERIVSPADIQKYLLCKQRNIWCCPPECLVKWSGHKYNKIKYKSNNTNRNKAKGKTIFVRKSFRFFDDVCGGFLIAQKAFNSKKDPNSIEVENVNYHCEDIKKKENVSCYNSKNKPLVAFVFDDGQNVDCNSSNGQVRYNTSREKKKNFERIIKRIKIIIIYLARTAKRIANYNLNVFNFPFNQAFTFADGQTIYLSFRNNSCNEMADLMNENSQEQLDKSNEFDQETIPVHEKELSEQMERSLHNSILLSQRIIKAVQSLSFFDKVGILFSLPFWLFALRYRDSIIMINDDAFYELFICCQKGDVINLSLRLLILPIAFVSVISSIIPSFLPQNFLTCVLIGALLVVVHVFFGEIM